MTTTPTPTPTRARLLHEYTTERIADANAADYVRQPYREGFPSRERVAGWNREWLELERRERAAVVAMAEPAHPQDTTSPGYDPRVAMLQCGLAWEPGARLIGNVTAADVAKVAALTMTQCPACGSEAWVNIDCDVCAVVSKLLSDVPELKKEGSDV